MLMLCTSTKSMAALRTTNKNAGRWTGAEHFIWPEVNALVPAIALRFCVARTQQAALACICERDVLIFCAIRMISDCAAHADNCRCCGCTCARLRCICCRGRRCSSSRARDQHTCMRIAMQTAFYRAQNCVQTNSSADTALKWNIRPKRLQQPEEACAAQQLGQYIAC